MSYVDPYDAGAVGNIADALYDMTESAARSRADSFEMRQILRFVSQVVQIVDQSFEAIYVILVEFSYLTEVDVINGRHFQLQKELDLLVAKSHFRESTEICSRLRHLGELYGDSIEPIIRANRLNTSEWSSVFALINEYEGAIMNSMSGTIASLRREIAKPMPESLDEIRQFSRDRADALRENLDRLRDLNAKILGLSGHEGLLALSAVKGESLAQFFYTKHVEREGIFVGDTYSNISNSQIVNRSTVEKAFNSVKSKYDAETAEAIRRVAEAVSSSGNTEAGELLNQFNEELAKPEPRKSLLKRSWDGLVEVLPAVTAIAGATGAIAKLFV